MGNERKRNVNVERDFKTDQIADLRYVEENDSCPKCGKSLTIVTTMEVGHIFKLGTKYSRAMNATCLDSKGIATSMVMGCYGIGSGRTLATIVEKYHDEKGIIWPESVAPFKVHLIGLDLNNKEISSKVHKVYKVLKENNIEVLFDDRTNVTAGEKFSDADLIGIPIRLVVSKRTGEKVEYKKRNEKEVKIMPLEEVIKNIKK